METWPRPGKCGVNNEVTAFGFWFPKIVNAVRRKGICEGERCKVVEG